MVCLVNSCLVQTDETEGDLVGGETFRQADPGLQVDLDTGKIIKMPVTSQPQINITEELNKSGVWKSLEPQKAENLPKKKSKKERKMSLVEEDHEEEAGITNKVGKQ